MGTLADISGQKFGRLTAIRRLEFRPKPCGGGRSIWLCSCNCGGETKVAVTDLRAGRRVSCGCLRREKAKTVNRSHGMSATPEFFVWTRMIRRCFDTKDKAYSRYGAIGISVCDEWRHDFGAFFSHIGPRPTPNHSIERINNSKGYEPGNVKWATDSEQRRNKRNSIYVEMEGNTVFLKDYCREHGIDYFLIHSRLKSGWPIHLAISEPSARKLPCPSRP